MKVLKANLNKVIEGAFTSEKDIDIAKRLKLDLNNAAVFTDFDKIMEDTRAEKHLKLFNHFIYPRSFEEK